VTSTRHSPPPLVWLGAALIAAPLVAATPGDGYHRRSEVETMLAGWAEAHPQLATLETAGTSAGGHPLQVLRLAADGPLAPDRRPGIFVGANAAGYHNAGTEAALHLIETVLDGAGGELAELLRERVLYVAPVLNPDAHDALFGSPRMRRSGNAQRLDQDRDGVADEDGADDLDGDGRITQLRIVDPAGGWLPHPDEPRLMVRADAARGWVGSHRLIELEGDDDDGDGDFNEDDATGVAVDRNFPHAFPFPAPEAGPFPMYAPESHALAEFLFAHPNVALAVIYGPANNLLELPRSLGGGGDLGTQTFKVPEQAAEFLGLDPEQEYTIDEVWEVVKDLPFARQNNVTKEQLAQFLGAGAATKVDDDDLKALEDLAEDYKTRLDEAGLSKDRPGQQYRGGGLTPWLYYQYGALALELDVWGVPKAAKKKDDDGEEKPLSVESLAEMSAEDFLALGEEKIDAFMKELGVPPQMTAAMIMQRVESGQVTPKQMAEMIKRMPGGGGGGGGDKDEDDAATKRRREVLAWLDEHAPGSVAPWTAVTLKDGTRAEAGGLDPFAELAPPRAVLEPALAVHTATVLDLARRMARLRIVDLRVSGLGGGVYRVEATARNDGELATHTKMAVRARARLPVRLELETGGGVSLVTGYPAVVGERLEGRTGILQGSWLVRAEPGATIAVTVTSETAGGDRRTYDVSKGASR